MVLTVNQVAPTIEVVVSRRRKVVSDMTDQMVLLSTSNLEQADEWALLRAVDGGMRGATRFIQSFRSAAEHAPEYYNDDEQLGDSVMGAVKLSNILKAWPAGLKALMSREKKEHIADLVPALNILTALIIQYMNITH